MRPLVFVFILASQFSYGQDALDIINRYIDTVSNGDVRNWNSIKSVYSESESYYGQQAFDQKVDLLKKDKPNFQRSYRVPPYDHRIELYEDSTFTKLLSTFYYLKDRNILLIGNIPPIIKEAGKRDEFFSDYPPVYIWKLVDKSKSMELLGIKQFPVDGLSCYEIKVSTKGRDYFFYIDTKSFLLNYWSINGEGDRSSLFKFYNYKSLDDFLIPMSESSMRNGTIFYWNNIKKIVLNSKIDPKLFQYEDK